MRTHTPSAGFPGPTPQLRNLPLVSAAAVVNLKAASSSPLGAGGEHEKDAVIRRAGAGLPVARDIRCGSHLDCRQPVRRGDRDSRALNGALDQPRINAIIRVGSTTADPLDAELGDLLGGGLTYNFDAFYDTGASNSLIGDGYADSFGVPVQIARPSPTSAWAAARTSTSPMNWSFSFALRHRCRHRQPRHLQHHLQPGLHRPARGRRTHSHRQRHGPDR